MAKKNFSFEKRRRELDKKAKKEARKQAKEENKAQAATGAPDPDALPPGNDATVPTPAASDADSPA